MLFSGLQKDEESYMLEKKLYYQKMKRVRKPRYNLNLCRFEEFYRVNTKAD